ncbi:hypothetical protein ACEWY4_009564 [Coilia grayii]|uniref:Ig-like domain-containing protein n=1 Tax=Coilia grayii TaxID=363190 RepID=A0ABD1K6S3_9TELE
MTEGRKRERKGRKNGGKRGRKGNRDPTEAGPKLKRMKSPVFVAEGKRHTLKCEATGSPTISYKWYKDGNELRKSKEIKIKTGKRNSRVQINNARLEDSGNYTCVAENDFGMENGTSTVHVQSVPAVPPPPQHPTTPHPTPRPEGRPGAHDRLPAQQPQLRVGLTAVTARRQQHPLDHPPLSALHGTASSGGGVVVVMGVGLGVGVRVGGSKARETWELTRDGGEEVMAAS